MTIWYAASGKALNRVGFGGLCIFYTQAEPQVSNTMRAFNLTACSEKTFVSQNPEKSASVWIRVFFNCVTLHTANHVATKRQRKSPLHYYLQFLSLAPMEPRLSFSFLQQGAHQIAQDISQGGMQRKEVLTYESSADCFNLFHQQAQAGKVKELHH